MQSHQVHFNGVDPLGNKLAPTHRLGHDQPPNRQRRLANRAEGGATSGVAEQDLGVAGWGVIFSPRTGPALRRALSPLLRHRHRQAAARFRDDLTWTGRRTIDQWIKAHARDGRLPFYLLIVGDASSVPFELQFRLERSHAVGRIYFQTPAEYRAYAQHLVADERGPPKARRDRRVNVFATRTPNDPATRLIADDLAVPLARRFAKNGSAAIGRGATKARLIATLRRPPAVLVTTSHGYARLKDYYNIAVPALRRAAEVLVPWSGSLARADNGALICQDWEGFEPGGIIPRSVPTPPVLFAGEDVSTDLRLGGLIAILVACFSGGTPRLATYSPRGKRAPRIADRSFVARLPQCLLRQGAIAVIGQVEQASADTVRAPIAVSRHRTFERFITRVLGGERVGSAMTEFRGRANYFEARWRSLAAGSQRTASQRAAVTAAEFAFDDARNFILIGDPAGHRR